jgi:hypothetical protein
MQFSKKSPNTLAVTQKKYQKKSTRSKQRNVTWQTSSEYRRLTVPSGRTLNYISIVRKIQIPEIFGSPLVHTRKRTCTYADTQQASQSLLWGPHSGTEEDTSIVGRYKMLSGEQRRLKGAGLLRAICNCLPTDTVCRRRHKT